MTGWNLPPGCSVRDIPGNHPLDLAYEQGMDASHRLDNPYSPDSEEWQSWDDGWNDRQIEAEMADDGYQHDGDDYADRERSEAEWKSRR